MKKKLQKLQTPNRMTLLRRSDGFATLDLISMLVIFTWLNFPFFTVKKLRLLRLKWHFYCVNRIHSASSLLDTGSGPVAHAKTLTLRVSALKGFIWFFFLRIPRAVQTPCILRKGLVAMFMESGRWFRVHKPAKAAQSWEKAAGKKTWKQTKMAQQVWTGDGRH